MPNIYDITFQTQTRNLVPPLKRRPRRLAFLDVPGSNLQYRHDLFFTDYAGGSSAPDYTGAGNIKGDRVRYTDNSVYEAIQAVPVSTPPTGLPTDTYWIKVLNIWIGLRERCQYNSQTIILEYALNKYFRTTFNIRPTLPDIWIENLSLNNVPSVYFFNNAETTPQYVFNNSETTPFYIWNISDYFPVNNFTVHVPVAVWTALAATNENRDAIIQFQVDKYKYYPIRNNIETY